jgi:hypothetical protein
MEACKFLIKFEGTDVLAIALGRGENFRQTANDYDEGYYDDLDENEVEEEPDDLEEFMFYKQNDFIIPPYFEYDRQQHKKVLDFMTNNMKHGNTEIVKKLYARYFDRHREDGGGEYGQPHYFNDLFGIMYRNHDSIITKEFKPKWWITRHHKTWDHELTDKEVEICQKIKNHEISSFEKLFEAFEE